MYYSRVLWELRVKKKKRTGGFGEPGVGDWNLSYLYYSIAYKGVANGKEI